MKYREEMIKTKEYKQHYLDGFEKTLLSRQKELAQKRSERCKNIFAEQETYREEFKKMLGWPLFDASGASPSPTEGIPAIRKEKLSDESGYSVYRMHFEVLDGLIMSGLYFEMNGDEKKPLVLVQHGGWGTPELISGAYGSTSNYNDMLERIVSRGVHAFAPQLLLWEPEKYGVLYDRTNIDARLKRVGSSVTAVELYGMMRILDYFEGMDNVSSFGMVGLSYGGFYTLLLSAVDTRIKSAISCSYFNTRDKYPWSDWTWFKSAELFDDAEIACLVYPRRLCIEIAKGDPLFDVQGGIDSYNKILELSGSVGNDWLTFITFDGVHEFCRDDEPIERLIRDISDVEI